jgi:hypothetical protein
VGLRKSILDSTARFAFISHRVSSDTCGFK